jgi:hypothetical protein
VAVSIINQSNESIILQVTIPFTRSMLNSESIIQDSINEVGCVATRELLKTFDTEGQSIQFGSVKMTTKGLYNKTYQTPYSEVDVARHPKELSFARYSKMLRLYAHQHHRFIQRADGNSSRKK